MLKRLVFLAVVSVCLALDLREGKVYSNSWAVEVSGGDAMAESIARRHGFTNMGRVGSLEGVYHFIHHTSPKRSRRSLDYKHLDLMAENQVTYVEQQVVKRRVKRDYSPPTDSNWPQQWYLHRANGHHMNLELAWEQDIIGRGAVISILDDGIEYTHPDLQDNYDKLASYDFNKHDADPFPRYDVTNENKHGTRCAGEVAANRDGSCGVGAAYGAKVGGVRMLDGDVTDVVESSSLSLNPQHIDIYSSSWGPNDDGQTVDGPGKLAKQAFIDGITKGRGGLGSIFVWAAGNGGRFQDSCNCDGYAVSPFTVSVGSASESDSMPWYGEVCSSTLAATYSSGGNREKQIATTDLHKKCTVHHTGTSASAPLAAGILALALEANRNLTWRDIQYLVVYSSNPGFANEPHWETNGAGLRVSHKYGFGVIDGAAIVNRARNWINVPPRKNCTIDVPLSQKSASVGNPLTVTVQVLPSNCALDYLEHVQAITTLNLDEGHRGDVRIQLTSPKQKTSLLLPYRNRDNHMEGFHKWPFMTVHNWGETPTGDWKLNIETKVHDQYHSKKTKISLTYLQLVFYGTLETPTSVASIPTECHANCAGKCAKAGAMFCDMCKDFRLASSMECVESCPVGTYVNYHMCRECPEFCAECTDGQTCIRCENGAVKLDSNTCAKSCPDLTYLSDDHSCQNCHHSCLSCNGSSEYHCTDCPGQFTLKNGSCQLLHMCSEGEYFDDRALECRFCHKSCAVCSGKEHDQCTACFPGNVLANGTCQKIVKDCPHGQYYNDIYQNCVSCPDGCTDCNDDITCSSCEEGHFLVSERVGESHEETKLCMEKCSHGFYGDTDNSKCQPCPSYCDTCNSPDDCTSCTLNLTQPVNGQCAQPCHDQQYYDFDSRQCQACMENCQSCKNRDQCLQCAAEYFLMTNGTCVTSCPMHTVADRESHICQDTMCHSSCLTCYGPAADQCISCVSGMVLHDNSCQQDCPEHTFFNGTSCSDCHSMCLTCAGPTEGNCLTCPTGTILNHYHCVPSCPLGSFISNGECLACPADCMNCSSAVKCDVCKEAHMMMVNTHTCVSNCPVGYMVMQKNCLPCPTHCDECSTTTQCDKCEDGYTLNAADGSCLLPPCPEHCLSCTSKDKCDVCKNGYLLMDEDHSCVAQCPKSYVEVNTVCFSCPLHCEACSVTTDCETCEEGYPYYEPNRSCLQECPHGYYQHNQLRLACSECKFPCSTCVGPKATDCTDCARGYRMDLQTSKCGQCCNVDKKENHPCCDCDADDVNCIWIESFKRESEPEDRENKKFGLGFTLTVVGLIVLIAVVGGGVLGGIKCYQVWEARKKYHQVPKDPLEIVDFDSGSEAEVYSKLAVEHH